MKRDGVVLWLYKAQPCVFAALQLVVTYIRYSNVCHDRGADEKV